MSKTLTLAEVAAHDREEDCYLIIGNERTGGAKVYDVTKYLDEHPGGDAVLLELAGKYADDMFEDIGHSMNARQQLKEFLVGTLDATEEELQALRRTPVWKSTMSRVLRVDGVDAMIQQWRRRAATI